MNTDLFERVTVKTMHYITQDNNEIPLCILILFSTQIEEATGPGDNIGLLGYDIDMCKSLKKLVYIFLYYVTHYLGC